MDSSYINTTHPRRLYVQELKGRQATAFPTKMTPATTIYVRSLTLAPAVMSQVNGPNLHQVDTASTASASVLVLTEKSASMAFLASAHP